MATTSSSVSAIMTSIAAAAMRHGVHQAPTASGCRMISVMLTMPSGTTRIPKNVTIHGIVRHRRLSPMKPIRNSTMYATAPSPASGMGKARETVDVSTRSVPSPKNGSVSVATCCS